MKDENKTKKQLIYELTELRSQNAVLKKSITESISAQLAAEESLRHAESIVETVREPLLILDADLKIISTNHNFYKTFKVNPGETLGRFIFDLGNKQWNIPGLRMLLEGIILKDTRFDDYEVEHEFLDIGHKIMLLNARRIYRKDSGAHIILLAIEDITERKRLENLLTESEERYRRAFETASDGIVFLEKREGKITHANPATEKILGYSLKESIGNKLQDIGVFLDIDDFQTMLQTLNEIGIIYYNNVPVKTKSGRSIDTDIYLVDRARLLQCNIRDITGHKQAEEALRTSEAIHRRLVETANEAIYVAQDDMLKFVNRMTFEITGYSEQELTSTPFPEFIHPDDRDVAVERHLRRIKGEAVPDRNQCRIIARDGSVKWAEISGVLIEWEGRPATLNLLTDITERKRAEEALQKSEDRYRTLVENASDIVFRTDNAGRFTFINPAALRITGYKEDEILGIHYPTLIRSDMREEAIKFFGRQFVKGIRNTYSEYPILTKEGHEVWLGQNTQLIIEAGYVIGFQAISRDITERKRAEKALRESEERYGTVLDEMEEGYQEVDLTGNFTFFNEAFLKIFGYTAEEMMGNNYSLYAADEEIAKKVYRAYNRMYKTGIPLKSFEWDIIRKDGARRTLEFYASMLRDSNNRPEGFRGIVRDVTDRRRVEQAIKESEEKYRSIFENAVEGIYQATLEGKIRSANPAFARILGYDSPEELMGSVTNIAKELYVDPGHRTELIRIIAEQGSVSAYEIKLCRKDKSIIWISLNARAIRDKNEDVFMIEGIAQDITSRKQAEEELLKTLKQLQDAKDMLVQSEKLSAIGRLSAGVGHEILNPLNIISMRMQFLEMTEKLSDKVKEGFATMYKQIDRIVKITKDLSQFSRITKRDMAKKDLNQLMEHILSLVIHRLRVEQVTLKTEFQPDLPQILMEPDRIEQVVMNLINNAVDALEGRENKVIRIALGLTRREGRDYLKLTISDNGTGISRENIDKLFDPFFTTKEAGKGTGLGLHICYTIIQEHGGQIWAENNEEGGASFMIELPIEEQEKRT